MSDERLQGIERCQSPLEIVLAQALAEAIPFTWRESGDHEWEVGRWKGWMLALLAQPAYDKYRPDFGICTWVHDPTEAPPFILIVEVDGHEFHERTKEQVRRDKERDRFMTTTGAKILRFSGSEVHSDPTACAEQILQYAIELQKPHLTEQFKNFVAEGHPPNANCDD